MYATTCAHFTMQNGPDFAPDLLSEPDGGPGPWSDPDGYVGGYCADLHGFGLLDAVDCYV